MPRPAAARPARPRLAVAALVLASAVGCSSGGGRAASFLPPSRPAQFSMAGISWGIGPDSVAALVEPRGYNLNSVDADGDMLFDGVLYRTPTRVFAFMASPNVASGTPASNVAAGTAASGGERKLVKLRVYMNTEDADALSTYQTARAELIKQYGQPSETEEVFQAPYRKGDGKEIEAFRAGKAHLATHWLPGAGARARTAHVSVAVTRELTVAVDYEGSAWEKESVRRRRQASR